ncbi:NAD-dependent epimerase/dehydratase family protein [Vibrio sp. FNV 38]|nr:NAD-dependent epimerase/dehydratase family protein [Vibrio sp. FNV 38]
MKIVVVGGGWLGSPLSLYLMKAGHQVLVTKTTSAGSENLHNLGLDSCVLDLNRTQDKDSQNTIKRFQPDMIIGCFPPGLRSVQPSRYVENWQAMVDLCQSSFAKKVIMISTTGVYPSEDEEMHENLNLEHQILDAKAQLLRKAELEVANSGIDYTILRCSGLIGPQRHPARFAQLLKSISDRAAANMVHLDDVIGAIDFIVSHFDDELETCGIFNVTTPNTVSKYAFYERAIACLDEPISLPPPTHNGNKKIIADKLIALGYDYKYPHIFNALDSL